MKVWRFPLVPTDEQDEGAKGLTCEIEMPKGAYVFNVQLSSRGLTLYALVDPDAETETRSFFVCGNDVELPEAAADVLAYRGTYKEAGGITCHVFELWRSGSDDDLFGLGKIESDAGA